MRILICLRFSWPNKIDTLFLQIHLIDHNHYTSNNVTWFNCFFKTYLENVARKSHCSVSLFTQNLPPTFWWSTFIVWWLYEKYSLKQYFKNGTWKLKFELIFPLHLNLKRTRSGGGDKETSRDARLEYITSTKNHSW